MADLWTRIDDELRRRRRKWAWLGRAVNATDQAMHNWKTRGIPARQHKPIADALGWSVDQLLDEDWTPEQHSGAGANAHCDKAGQALETVNATSVDPVPFVRAGSAKLEFRCAPK